MGFRVREDKNKGRGTRKRDVVLLLLDAAMGGPSWEEEALLLLLFVYVREGVYMLMKMK